MSNFQLVVNVKGRIMSTSITLVDQNLNTNDVDIMVFERCLCPTFPLQPLGGDETYGPIIWIEE